MVRMVLRPTLGVDWARRWALTRRPAVTGENHLVSAGSRGRGGGPEPHAHVRHRLSASLTVPTLAQGLPVDPFRPLGGPPPYRPSHKNIPKKKATTFALRRPSGVVSGSGTGK